MTDFVRYMTGEKSGDRLAGVDRAQERGAGSEVNVRSGKFSDELGIGLKLQYQIKIRCVHYVQNPTEPRGSTEILTDPQ